MVKIGNVELKGELVELEVDQFIEDVPVGEKHVQYLMGSLKQKGQVEPLLVWAEGKRIINGFHRLRAMKLLGWKVALCLVYSCSEEDFWGLRISSAVTHRSVMFPRIVEWVRRSFSTTKWSGLMNAQEAFRMGKRGAAVHHRLSPQDRRELTDWVIQKSKQWDLTPLQIGRMLRIAEMSDPLLVGQVRDEPKPGNLTQAMLDTISSKLPRHDLQKTVVDKVRAEGLSATEVKNLVNQLAPAKTEEERERILRPSVSKSTASSGQRSTKSAVRELQAVRTGIVRDSLQQLVLVLPELKRPQPFDEMITDAIGALAVYQEGEMTEALSILQRENQSLKRQTKELSEKLDRKERDMASMRGTMGSMQQEIDTLRRRD